MFKNILLYLPNHIHKTYKYMFKTYGPELTILFEISCCIT